jgi:hypothetical protein
LSPTQWKKIIAAAQAATVVHDEAPEHAIDVDADAAVDEGFDLIDDNSE